MNLKTFIAALAMLCCLAVLPLSGKSRDKKSVRVDYKGTHEIDFSMGLPSIQSSMLLYDIVQGPGLFISAFFASFTHHVPDRGPLEPVVSGALRLPLLRAEYGYNVSHWFNIGCGICYNFNRFPLRYTETEEFAWNEKEHVTSIMFNVKFYWLNRGIVRMYSGLGVGIGMITTNMLAKTEEESTEMPTMLMPSVDIRLLGLTVGRELYGRFELGALSSGLITAGIGYRF